ncbi:Nucleoside diphosphate kinase [Gracilariopsis chorda]|uniref:Nucleoside diphosphate kinase n=1 Tax=Gracilariopsis chorda TaxID=448386 RepID=A0A2V3IWP0_9FLOR|nr:Nucleoside diphosphate kinase [Gracilariopsis chorda]|eukprot:PXF46566.1 Nucleoside diphosphate kinase [Gracilariopsis chorda]
MARTERTFIAVKPDGMNRGILGNIISRFEAKGYKLVGIKTLVPSKQLAEEHYSALKEKPFFKDLVDFITSGPVCAMVWEGEQVVVTARKMIGETNPLSSAPGTIRGDFAVDVGRNVIHGSDAVETAQREISLWFEQGELTAWEPTSAVWIYE